MPAAPPKSVSVSGAVALMEIPQGNTLENSGKQNPKMGFKSPPEQRRPPKGHALKYFLRALQPCLNTISLSRPMDSPRTTYAASCPTKACISRLVTLACG